VIIGKSEYMECLLHTDLHQSLTKYWFDLSVYWYICILNNSCRPNARCLFGFYVEFLLAGV